MKRNPLTNRRRSAFTLVELLTVVAIIALLIGIMVPSLTGARDRAKDARVMGIHHALDAGLKMFSADFGDYPESRWREDPITDWSGWPTDVRTSPPPGENRYLSGTHWLARAMAGPDLNGVDATGKSLQDYNAQFNNLGYQDVGNDKDLIVDLSYNQAIQRKRLYVENSEIFAVDGPPTFMASKPPATWGRLMTYDNIWESPILYYKANTRAKDSFCINGNLVDSSEAIYVDPDSLPDYIPDNGVYNLWDNAAFTGAYYDVDGNPEGSASAVNSTLADGFDFASTNRKHGLGFFGLLPVDSDDPVRIVHTKPPSNQNFEGVSFVEKFHNHNAGESAGQVKPQNQETYILISAGKDGLFGTDDDITNFGN